MSINAFYSTLVTSTGAPQAVSLATNPQFVKVKNLSLYGYAGTSVIPLETTLIVNSTVASTVGLATSATAPNVGQIALSTGGISVSSTAPMSTGSPITITGITAANPAVITTATPHGLQTGQTIWICSATGMQQIAQMAFTVTATGANTLALPYLNASGFAAAATGGSIVPIYNYGSGLSPFTNTITSIVSSGSQTLVTFGVAQTLQVGQTFRFAIPSLFGGFAQLNLNTGQYAPSNLGGYELVAFNSTTNTATFDINSTSYGTFAFPSNATVITEPSSIVQAPQMARAGTNFGTISTSSPTQNTQTYYAVLGAQVCGRSGDVLLIEYGWLGN